MKRLSYSFALMVAVLALNSTSHAQLVPRTVLLEEGTNWSCGPCASMNPGVEAFLKQHEGNVIHLAYHPNWPGADDPMYLNDTRDNQYRVATYYSITGVPSVSFDGAATYVPGSQAALEGSFETRIGVGSPVAISVGRQVSGDEVTVTVTVHPVQDLSSYTKLRLRVAAVEEFVDGPGPNGEKKYVHPMRTMMPDYNGTLLRLGAGDTTLTFTYTIDGSYNADNMYEVAFLQNDATKEVLQAATDQPGFELAPDPGQQWIQRASSATPSVNFSLRNTSAQSADFHLTFSPTSKNPWPITINGMDASTPQTITIAGGGSKSLSVQAARGSGTYSSGIITASATMGGEPLTSSFDVKFVSPSVKIAAVDIQGDSTYAANMMSTLDAMQFQYVPLSAGEASILNAWRASEFPEVMVCADKWIITGANKTAVSSYLASGGHLFLYGGEIAYGLADNGSTAGDRDPTFLKTVLKATYVKDSAGPFTVHGVTDDPISGPFVTNTLNINASRLDETNQPDVIKPAGSGTPIFYYGTGTAQCAGVRWDSVATGGMLAYLAFGLQNLAEQDRVAVTNDVFTWFRNGPQAPPAGVGADGTASFELSQNYPNPFGALTTIPYSTTEDGLVRLAVTDARGVEIAVLANNYESAGRHFASFDGATLTPGTYFVTLRTTEGSKTRAVIIE